MYERGLTGALTSRQKGVNNWTIVLASLSLAASCAVPAASAQTAGELGRSVVNAFGAAIERGKLRKTVTQLSVPLQYEDAAGALDPSNNNDPRNLDVAGVRLGMNPADAERALRASGYEDSGIHPVQPSYDTTVRNAWHTQHGAPAGSSVNIPEALIWRKPGQEVRVTFLALPEGPR